MDGDAYDTKSVPKATLQKYPVYLKALRKLKRGGTQRIMSRSWRAW
ncbi:MAG: winged-helix domain-containing protein [Merdibacter sp.]